MVRPPTPRELEVFQAVSGTGSYQEAADQLGISRSGVGNALQSLYRRLGVSTLREARRALAGEESAEVVLPTMRVAISQARERRTPRFS